MTLADIHALMSDVQCLIAFGLSFDGTGAGLKTCVPSCQLPALQSEGPVFPHQLATLSGFSPHPRAGVFSLFLFSLAEKVVPL